MKKTALIFMFTVVMVILAGCGTTEETMIVNNNGSATANYTTSINKDYYDRYIEATKDEEALLKTKDYSVKIIDGVAYYVESKDSQLTSIEELRKYLTENNKYVRISQNGLRFITNNIMEEGYIHKFGQTIGVELSSQDYAKIISITMPDDILVSTGSISADKKTATWQFYGAEGKEEEIMVSTKKETEKPIISGVKNNGIYNKLVGIYLIDDSGIKSSSYTVDKKNKGEIVACSRQFFVNGTYRLAVEDYYGNKATKTFTIKDTKKPSVSGAKNNKVYKSSRTIGVQDNCQIKTVTLNGVKVGTNLSVSKKGKYKLVAIDVNGLTRTVNFKIK